MRDEDGVVAAVLALPRDVDDTNTNKLQSHVPWHPHDLGDRFGDARCHAAALGATREKASAAALLRLDTLGHNALFLRPLFTSAVAVSKTAVARHGRARELSSSDLGADRVDRCWCRLPPRRERDGDGAGSAYHAIREQVSRRASFFTINKLVVYTSNQT